LPIYVYNLDIARSRISLNEPALSTAQKRDLVSSPLQSDQQLNAAESHRLDGASNLQGLPIPNPSEDSICGIGKAKQAIRKGIA
jgi:hypothetical protein